jgi:undecaprenyl pyrophosphate phosphatase UppP
LAEIFGPAKFSQEQGRAQFPVDVNCRCSVVTGSIGLLFSDYITEFFKSTLLVGFMLLITGAILKLITILPVGMKDKGNITLKMLCSLAYFRRLP